MFVASFFVISVSLFAGDAFSFAADSGQDSFTHGAWPFHPPARSAVPVVENGHWLINPIDAFIIWELERAGLSPNRRADNLALLRRVTFDLTGLPPSRQEQQSFLADRSPDAYQMVVDRLLSSPVYGERWAQHWLDVVRYAETEGFKSDRLRSNAYKYRDYVIRSMNADRPYDEFVRQQLAGDQLQPDNPEALIATGINRLYPDEDNAANLFQRRQEILNDVTETTGLAFMGLTMGCAQCHDHKFDEILQTDFYRLQAFFTPMIERDDLPAASPDQISKFREKYAIWNEATLDIRKQMDDLLAAERKKSNDYNLTKFRPEIQECYNKPPAERTPLEAQIARMATKQLSWRFAKSNAVKKLSNEQQARYRGLEKRLQQFDRLKPPSLPQAMAVSDVGQVAPPTYLLDGGNWQKPKQEVQPGFPEFLGGAVTTVSLTSASVNFTGRRAELAEWLTRRNHPLTARVIVNRLWYHHFGRGIVATPNDFGNMGESPTHPELLDWLAVELMEHNWSLKHVHRLIVTSAAYCQSSQISQRNPQHAKALKVDGDNHLLWHARRRRLEGEAIRDAMLQVAGRLNGRMFGPGVHPPLPEGVSPRYAWEPDVNTAEHTRRSIYVLAKRNMRFPLLDVFDLPDMHASCARRSTATNAPQALLMLNSRLTQQLARGWANRLIARFGEDLSPLIDEAYHVAFGRAADSEEIEAAQRFLIEHTRLTQVANESTIAQTDREDPSSARVSASAVADFCHALFNSNEFVYLD